MIGIIDYGMGNLKSIYKAFEHLGYPVKFISKPGDFNDLKGLVLPGVGAFPEAMKNMIKSGLSSTIKEYAASGKPLLGICLGMHLLFEKGYENEVVNGLGLLPGEIKNLSGGVKIPHMGWNMLTITRSHPLLQGLSINPYVYFVHSYVLSKKNSNVIGTTTYGKVIPVAVADKNIMGLQFHPEKSGDEGMTILKNFGAML